MARQRFCLLIAAWFGIQPGAALFGFSAAVTALNARPGDLPVWDIGGGSMQISVWDERLGKVVGYRGKSANNAMLEFTIGCLRMRGHQVSDSPNPIHRGSDSSDPANCLAASIAHARAIARSTANREQLEQFRKFPVVVGIGGVHAYSNCEITGQPPGCSYRRNSLHRALAGHANLTDHELVKAKRAGSLKYAPMRITAGALTVGFMEVFGFDQVRTLDIDMAHGILLESRYWQ